MVNDAQYARQERGFSLIELMIVVAIIAIIAAVAVPSYQDSIWKGKRGEAKAAILKALQAEERYYTQSNTYVDANDTTKIATANRGAFPAFSADNQANSRYTITYTKTGGAGLCADADFAKCVIVTATVVGSADPVCGSTLQMDTVGNKLPAQSARPRPAGNDVMRRAANGFTLIELMFTVTLIAIMIAIAVPSVASFISNYRATAAVNDLLQAITMTRGEALKRGRRVTLAPIGGNFAKGWTVYIESSTASPPSWSSGEELIFQHDPLPATITLSAPSSPATGVFGGANYVTFDGTGYPRTIAGGTLNGGIVLTDSMASPNSVRTLCLSLFGRPQIVKTVPPAVPPSCS